MLRLVSIKLVGHQIIVSLTSLNMHVELAFQRNKNNLGQVLQNDGLFHM